MSKNKQKAWHGRGFTSLLTLTGFVVLSLTGMVLFFVPHGRIAYWTHWTFLGLDKTQWADTHVLACLLFLVVSVIHIVYNWRVMWSYLKNKAKGGIRLKKELLLSVLISVFLVISGIMHLPPLAYVLDLSEAIKDSWVTSKEYEPPFGHAELLSLKVFCRKVGIPHGKARAELAARGIVGLKKAKTLGDIAKANDSSPMDLYRLIKHLERAHPQMSAKPFQNVEAVQQAFAGTGIGNKSIEDIAKRVKQPASALFSRLKGRGFVVEPGESIKQAASRLDRAPLQILEAALVEGNSGTE